MVQKQIVPTRGREIFYSAPEIEKFEIQIEHGFAQSGTPDNPGWGGEPNPNPEI